MSHRNTLVYILHVTPIKKWHDIAHCSNRKYLSFYLSLKSCTYQIHTNCLWGSEPENVMNSFKFTRSIVFALAHVHDGWLGSDHFLSHTPHSSSVFPSCMSPITSWHVLISRITNLKLALTQSYLSDRNHEKNWKHVYTVHRKHVNWQTKQKATLFYIVQLGQWCIRFIDCTAYTTVCSSVEICCTYVSP